MLGKCDGDVRLSLFVFALINLETAAFLRKRLPETYDVAVARQHEHAANERLLDIVIGDKLVLQKANQRLRHRKSNRFHSDSSILKIWSFASGCQSHSCSGSSMRVFSQGLSGKWRMPHI